MSTWSLVVDVSISEMDNGFVFSGTYFFLLVLRQSTGGEKSLYGVADGKKHSANYLTGAQIFYK